MAKASVLLRVAFRNKTSLTANGLRDHLTRAHKLVHRRTLASAGSYITPEWTKRVQEEKILRSPYQGKPIPETSFPEVVFSLMEKHRNNTMIINGLSGQKYSYHECLKNIERVASGLIKRGLKPGDNVALYSFNQPEYFMAFMAVIACGGTSVDINPNYIDRELKTQIDATNCKYIFSHLECAERAESVAKLTPQVKDVFVFGESSGCVPFSQLLEDDGVAYKGPHTVGDPRKVIAQMPGSSGTTGLPKSVLKSHYSLSAMTMGLSHEALVTNHPGHTGMLVLPLYHIFPLMMILVDAVEGAANVLLPKFLPDTFLGTIQKYKVRSMPIVPPLVLFMLNHEMVSKFDLSSLKVLIAGAAPIAPDVMLQFRDKFKLEVLRQGYGMTEICPVALGDIEDQDTSSVGRPTPNTNVKIVDLETEEVLGPNQRGQIFAQNPTMMNGYLNNPRATADSLDQEGWIHTGDIGYYNERGQVYIVDRLKDMIKYKGHQVAPAEIESILLNHPAVKDVAVLGIPDDRAGELTRAYVVIEDNMKGKVTEVDFCQFVAGQTAVEKHLYGGVIFMEVIPKSPSGKILKKDLRAAI